MYLVRVNQSCVYNLKFPPGGGWGCVLYRPTQHSPEEEGGGGGSRAWIFIKICTNRAFLCVFQPFLLRSFVLISLMSGPLKIWFCQFAHCTLCLKERHRSQNEGSLKSDWAISKSDVPSSDVYTYTLVPGVWRYWAKENAEIIILRHRSQNFPWPISISSQISPVLILILWSQCGIPPLNFRYRNWGEK